LKFGELGAFVMTPVCFESPHDLRHEAERLRKALDRADAIYKQFFIPS